VCMRPSHFGHASRSFVSQPHRGHALLIPPCPWCASRSEQCVCSTGPKPQLPHCRASGNCLRRPSARTSCSAALAFAAIIACAASQWRCSTTSSCLARYRSKSSSFTCNARLLSVYEPVHADWPPPKHTQRTRPPVFRCARSRSASTSFSSSLLTWPMRHAPQTKCALGSAVQKVPPAGRASSWQTWHKGLGARGLGAVASGAGFACATSLTVRCGRGGCRCGLAGNRASAQRRPDRCWIPFDLPGVTAVVRVRVVPSLEVSHVVMRISSVTAGRGTRLPSAAAARSGGCRKRQSARWHVAPYRQSPRRSGGCWK